MHSKDFILKIHEIWFDCQNGQAKYGMGVSLSVIISRMGMSQEAFDREMAQAINEGIEPAQIQNMPVVGRVLFFYAPPFFSVIWHDWCCMPNSLLRIQTYLQNELAVGNCEWEKGCYIFTQKPLLILKSEKTVEVAISQESETFLYNVYVKNNFLMRGKIFTLEGLEWVLNRDWWEDYQQSKRKLEVVKERFEIEQTAILLLERSLRISSTEPPVDLGDSSELEHVALTNLIPPITQDQLEKVRKYYAPE